MFLIDLSYFCFICYFKREGKEGGKFQVESSLVVLRLPKPPAKCPSFSFIHEAEMSAGTCGRRRAGWPSFILAPWLGQ